MSTFFSEKQQKPQQTLKPLIYDRQTTAKQENFTDDFFPLTEFWIIPPLGGLKRLREVRKQLLEILKQNIRLEKEKTREPEKQQEFDFDSDLINEFVRRF